MSRLTRRSFLKRTAAGVGVAGVVAAAPASTLIAADGSAAEASIAPETFHEPMLAYVHDAAKGELAVMVGERELVVKAPEVLACLARCQEA